MSKSNVTRSPRVRSTDEYMVLELKEERKGLLTTELVDRHFDSREQAFAWIVEDWRGTCQVARDDRGATAVRSMIKWAAESTSMITRGTEVLAVVEAETRNGSFWIVARDIRSGRVEERQVDLESAIQVRASA